MPNVERTREAEAFLEARERTAPYVVSSCAGWTAHEVTAHLAAAAAEISRHLEPHIQGDEVPPTRSFEEREPRWRAMDDATLCRRLADEGAKVRTLIHQALDQDADSVIPWTGRQMSVAAFVPHMRSEFAIHRWDFVGDGAHVELDAAARILVIWGRRPDRRGRFRSYVGEPTLRRLQALLSGY